MAQADTLVNLLKAASNGDLPTFRKAAESLIVEERSKGHRILADRLTKSMLPSVHRPNRPAITSPIRSGIDMQRDFFHEIQSERPLASLVISPLIFCHSV